MGSFPLNNLPGLRDDVMMTNEDITRAARSLRRIHETTDPRALCRYLGIQIDSFAMGSGQNALKGLITRNSRCATITINSDLPRRTQDIVIFHEIGHYALNHHTRKQICAFHDYGVFDNTSELEDEANRFVAEYLLENSQTLQALHDHEDFFTAASCLHVPREILDYKMRMLRYYELLIKECPIYTPRDCMGRIDCSGMETDDYA